MGIVTGYLSQLVTNGIKVLVGGTAVSSSNPLPVQNANAAPTDRSSIDAAANICKALAKSGMSQYKELLTKVADTAPNEKLKKYAAKYAAEL